MKNFLFTILMALSAFVMSSCKELQLPVSTPTVLTGDIRTKSSSSIIANGEVLVDGFASIADRGFAFGISQDPTIETSKISSGNGTGSFSAEINGLESGTIYHVRAFAINSKGISYGMDRTCLTDVDLPIVTTQNPTEVTFTTAHLGGSVTSEGGSLITDRGICLSTNSNPTITDRKISLGNGSGDFAGVVSGLIGDSTYYIRAYATNQQGTAYGNEIILSTPALTDIDENHYKVVEIGTQIWMAENLKTTKYQNGDAIPEVQAAGTWVSLSTGAYVYYNNDASNNKVFGKLYNWFAATDPRGVCPAGWHVPSYNEMVTLSEYLGGDAIAGGKLKLTGTTYWRSPNEATNETGFSAVATGARGNPQGDFGSGPQPPEPLYGCDLWTTDLAGGGLAHMRQLVYNTTVFRAGTNYIYYGMPIRCLKD